MSNVLDNISPFEVGERLRLAREGVKFTQIAAAEQLGMARTTLVAIEKGQRQVRLNELQQFSKVYKTTINSLLRKEAVQVEMAPRFRKMGAALDTAADDAVSLLNLLVRAEVELENLLGVKRSKNYPPERPLTSGDVREQAEKDALELRQWLGIGLNPVHDVVSILEMQLGARVFVRRLNGKVSGLFNFDTQTGPCILINANHPKDRRNQTGAHEIGHFIATRHAPEVLDGNSMEGSREEKYANTFSRAFLTPEQGVRDKFKEITAGSESLTRRHIIVMAHYFGVSREAMVRRLEELGLTKSGTWDWFVRNGGITDDQARSVLGESAFQDFQKADADRPLSLRLSILIEEIWKRELLSEGQIAQLLNLDRVSVREILDSFNIEGSGADDAPKLLI